ncbi:MAG: hypothetical protein I3273_02475 [Candidatus Moeniiplasma glomeromycotorum]|nr:hypothetical protein [Candidatus Moeniiplasma glomeromycotorum]MCE8167017.1 hypothetical protein [Candidatus Moeniiplasma glomeromycotorum]MCE8168971.1 hypothetical protein [Candidatus Moeniiplasma glomeromycotorum]
MLAKDCQCEGKDNCNFCKTNEPFPIACSCRKKGEEPNEETEEPNYHATLKSESEINWLEERLSGKKRHNGSYGRTDCKSCQQGKGKLQLVNCWHCGNSGSKTTCCGVFISDCSCPNSQTNCGRCEKCRPKHQKSNQNENKEKWKNSYSAPTYFQNYNNATQWIQAYQFQQMQQQCLNNLNSFGKSNQSNLNSQFQTARKQYDPCGVNKYKSRRKQSR